jgi:hypothetical protein
MNARESARQYAEELKAKRDAKNAADIAEYQAKREAYKTPENWRVNAVDAAKNAIDLPDFWTAVYGEKWRHFTADDESSLSPNKPPTHGQRSHNSSTQCQTDLAPRQKGTAGVLREL